MNILSNLKINIELRLRIFNRTFLPKKVTLHLQGDSSTWKQACVRFLNRILFFLSAWKTLKYSVLWLILGSFNKVSTSKLLETFSHNLKGTFTEIVTFGPGKCFVLYENNFILHIKRCYWSRVLCLNDFSSILGLIYHAIGLNKSNLRSRATLCEKGPEWLSVEAKETLHLHCVKILYHWP